MGFSSDIIVFDAKKMDNKFNSHCRFIKDAITSAAESTVGRRRGSRRESWISEKAWALIDERKIAKQKLLQKKDEETKTKYKQLDKQVKNQTRKDKQKWLENKSQEAQKAANRNDSRTVYKIIKELTNNTTKRQLPIKSREGNTISSEKETEKRWIEHFQSVLNQPEPQGHLNVITSAEKLDTIETGTISLEETRTAINKLKNNKSPGMDCIHPEMLKYGGETLVRILQHLCNKVWEEEKVPDDWKTGTIVPLPKKGDLSNCANWRGITLLSIPSKVMCIIILNRMKVAVDKILRDEQCGFRPGRSCTDAIFALRNIIEKTLGINQELFIHFVDFQKAFDSIHRDTMWKMLDSYGIPQKFIQVYQSHL